MITVELKTAEKTLTFNPSSIEIPAPGLNENLQHQEQSVSFSAIYDPELIKLTATERDITVTVRDDYTTIFTGRLSNNQSWQDNGRPTPIEKLSLSVSDNTYLLDRKTENIIALKNTTLAAVITRICRDCNVTIAYPETLPQISMEFFVMESGKKYKDVLDSVLIQHCYAYAFDGAGNLIIFDLNAELAKDPTPITESDLLTGVSVSQTTKDFSGAKVTYNPLLKKTNEQVYFEGNSLGSENTVTPITLRGGQYYPYDSDPVQEEREGQVYQTFASGYAESYTTYSGETKYQRSEKTTLLYTENHSLVQDWDTGIQVDRTQFEATRASVRFRNTTDGDRNLMQLAIRADAWYRNGDASVTSGDATGSLYETDAEYIFTAEKAEKLAKLCSRFFCGRTFKISARLNQPVIPGGNYSIDTGSSGTQFTALAISCTYDPDDAIYSATFLSYGAILVDITRFKETASGNPLDSVISEISNKLEGVISGQPEMGPPSPPKTLNAVAHEKGIQLSCVPEIVGVRNSLTAFKWEINKGNGWEQRESAEPSYFWQFDRSTDGYPEAADFAAWRVRCYVISIYGKNSEYTPEQNINTDQYGTWKLLPPKVTVSVSNRAINLKMEQPQRSDNRPVYGTLSHRIEVKNPKIDTEFFKPAESLDPYASELNYKEGSGYVTAVLSYTQIMPLEGQNDDPPGPTYTLYQFRITAANEATTSEPTIQNATANPTSVYDMVKGWYKNEQGEKVKIPGALGAENIYTESLATISANMGDITAGSISSVPEAGETKPNVLLDLDKEEFRIGNSPSLEENGSEDAEYIHYTKGQGLVMKIKNFVVTALASIISGIFRVKAKGTADSGSFFIVNPETTTDSTTGTPGKSVAVKGNMTVCNGYSRFIYPLPGNAGKYSMGKYVILLGKIPDPASREINSRYNWDISADITFIRASGHNVGYISVKAGHGYSHDWTTYINVERNEINKVHSIRPVTFLHNGIYWLGINIELDHEVYTSNAVVKTARNLEAESLSVLCYYNNYKGEFIRNEEIYNSIADVPSIWIKGKKFTGRITTDTLTVTGATTTDSLDAESADIRDLTARYVNGTVLASDDTNTGIGNGTLMFNTTGKYNTAVGIKSLGNNSSGAYNTAVGLQALTSNEAGHGNTATGYRAMVNNTTGHGNTAVGRGALLSNTTGSYNIALGEYRSCIKPDWDNQVNIGDRLHYIEFAASATHATVYSTLISFFPYSNREFYITALGYYIYDIGTIRNRNNGKIDFMNPVGSIALTVTKGSASTLGYPLRLLFLDVTYAVSGRNI